MSHTFKIMMAKEVTDDAWVRFYFFFRSHMRKKNSSVCTLLKHSSPTLFRASANAQTATDRSTSPSALLLQTFLSSGTVFFLNNQLSFTPLLPCHRFLIDLKQHLILLSPVSIIVVYLLNNWCNKIPPSP